MSTDQVILVQNIFHFIIGACFGSFINVIIYRLPIGESIIYPGSHCIKCSYKIRWFENIPIISWLILRGKCSNCKKRISLLYPIIELISGILFTLNNYILPHDPNSNWVLNPTIFGWILICMLLLLSILDIKYLWLPEFVCKIGILLGILFSLILDSIYYPSNGFSFILDSIIATLLGYLIFQLIIVIGLRIYHKPVMGKGDSNLAALLGSWLGIKGLGITLWLAFNLAGVFVITGLLLKKIKRNQKIPFGAFLAFSGLSVWYFGNPIFTKVVY